MTLLPMNYASCNIPAAIYAGIIETQMNPGTVSPGAMDYAMFAANI